MLWTKIGWGLPRECSVRFSEILHWTLMPIAWNQATFISFCSPFFSHRAYVAPLWPPRSTHPDASGMHQRRNLHKFNWSTHTLVLVLTEEFYILERGTKGNGKETVVFLSIVQAFFYRFYGVGLSQTDSVALSFFQKPWVFPKKVWVFFKILNISLKICEFSAKFIKKTLKILIVLS